MKEKYTKPSFEIETFTLTQSVAAGCSVTPGGGTLGAPNHWGKSDCGWDMGNMVVWTDANPGCDVPWGADDEMNGLCYNNPDGQSSIFGSY